MRIYLFRHADKERSSTNNPPLSFQGLSQAKAIVKLVETGVLQKPEILMSSPKIRAIQTLTPLAETYQLRVKETEFLDERKHSESVDAFLNRVRSLLSRLESQPGVTYLVTHYDWIEAALIAISCDTDLTKTRYQGWPPAQYMEFEITDGVWQLLQFGSVTV
jgi:broad specificity phosphatase PhoE